MQLLVLFVLGSFVIGGTRLGDRLRRWPVLVLLASVAFGLWYYRLGAVL